ncbi:KDO2-lipid IV(A) lauroyltransferase [Pustulibacterium marinum]|uniref:KDO2-lipid IV(A) lauroyltransferase n=1 Tax=Pustulibacterium marinum TaxID=1224947 RepID=A0A1I7ICW4_9FLAO|nr:lysophospholipid acyltransferase family protein [Pustulibacterium marinum]SFU70777.1 KDO2-lipid IV(A) lauroyltransferase [Pustulibacterium marinum]
MQLIVYLLLYPLLWFVSILPFSFLYVMSDVACFIVYKVLGYRVSVVRKNLRLAFPDKGDDELKLIEKKFYHHFCDTFLEMIKSMTISEKALKKRFVYTNLDVLKKFENNNQSIMLVLGHYGNWEWVMSLGDFIKHEGHAVYTPLANKYIDRLIRKVRLRHNSYLISRHHTVRTMLKHRTEKRLVIYGLISDQSPQVQHAHYWTQFLGINVPVYAGAEIMSKKFDAPVVFLNVEKQKRGYYKASFEVITDDPKSIPNYQITDTFNRLLEQQIRKAPAYYLWTHNRFKHKDKMPVKKQTVTSEAV